MILVSRIAATLAAYAALMLTTGCGHDASSDPDIAAVAPVTGSTSDFDDTVPEGIDKVQWPFPQERQFDTHRAILHAPQIQSWSDFKTFDGRLAVEFFPAGESQALMATARLSGATELRFDERLVIVTDPVVEEVIFAGGSEPEYEQAISNGVRRDRLEIPLDIFLAALAEDVLQGEIPAGFNTEAPPIYVAQSPTILLFVNGPALWQPLESTGVELLVNANWPTLREFEGDTLYLLDRQLWLRGDKLDGQWFATRELPAGLNGLTTDTLHPGIAAAVPAPATDQPLPKVIYIDRPAELIVTDGAPQLAEIEGTEGLQSVINTKSPLFRLEDDWYFLVAGRWFRSADINAGNWEFVTALPDAFAAIPRDHAMSAVRASVSGTLEARMASLESMLPRENTVELDSAVEIEVSYDGEPDFQPSGAENVSHAVNTQHDILLVDGVYYLCYQGAWYSSGAATGPWLATAVVPDAVFLIPPQSPAYTVTHVKVVSSTPSSVTYVYTPAYTSTVQVVYGVPWYGTGWYYPPYVGYYYYPYYTSYGHGNYYNPNTGAYGSRSVWYGPYGGYSYNEAYNPNTGRYGYAETAWDGDEWASHSEIHGSRTGITAETDRYYSEDKDRMSMERTLERGDQWMQTERGTAAGEGTPSRFKVTAVPFQDRVLVPQMRDDGTLDMRDLGDIETVRRGQVLIERIPASAEHDGHDVTGNSVPSQPPPDTPFEIGEGTEVSDTEPSPSCCQSSRHCASTWSRDDRRRRIIGPGCRSESG